PAAVMPASGVSPSCTTPTSTTTACASPVRPRPMHLPRTRRKSLMPRSPETPRLTFSPKAWLQYQFLCHAGPTEVGAFGRSDAAVPLYVEELLVMKQRTTAVTVVFDDTAVADLFDTMADAGVPPGRFARVWLHTHPGASVTPSQVDEETFDRVFGACDWAVMGILGRTGRTYARLRFRAGPGGAVDLATAVDWSAWPAYAQSPDLFDDLDRW